jgi:hypothetical protein
MAVVDIGSSQQFEVVRIIFINVWTKSVV